jgi:WD40 repeat protein
MASRLFDYGVQKTVARRTLPSDEMGVAGLHFVDPGSSTLDLIEVSAKGIVRVVKQIEGHSFSEESQIVQGFRLGDYGKGEQFVASWNTIKLDLLVAVSSERCLQIWDLPSAKRKAEVATGYSASVTCLDNEPSRGNLSLLGFKDGTVALFDVRQQSKHCVARWLAGHTEDVLTCCLTASQEIASMG